jgi:hypothetical protein
MRTVTITVKNQLAAALLCALLLSIVYAKAQERFEAGPYKGFLKENPELNKIKLPEPFRVSEVKGNITYSGARPLSGAVFEIRDSNGRVFSATTDTTGNFSIPLVPMGTYALKVTKNEFHSVVGTVVVSKNFSRTKSIKIQLRLGT